MDGVRVPIARAGWVRRVAVVVGLVLTGALLPPLTGTIGVGVAQPDDLVRPAEPQREPSVPLVPVRARPPATETRPAGPALPPAVALPAAGSARVDVPAERGAGLVRAGELPVWVGAAADGSTAPTRLDAQILDQDEATAAGVAGVLLRLRPADSATGPVTGPARVRVRVDYRQFRDLFGGDWALRLRLASLPDCALVAPQRPECRPVVLGSVNDGSGVEADVEVSGGGGLFAVTAGSSGSTGDYKATDLSPSATWSAGGSSGDFSWSYPLRVPPSLGGAAPELALVYSSGSVDGRTAATNSQASWVGEGFELPVGFVERRYKSCADDTAGAGNPATGDLCWGTDNATLSLGGRSTELIRDGGTGVWRLRDDDGSRVEKLEDPANGHNAGEHWRITTIDGTQYHFGVRADAASVWTVPVFGNHSGEPCHQASFASAWCQQAYRWNLDQVVDPNGNSTWLFYQAEQNYYGRNLGSAATPYVRGGHLSRIEYGRNTGVASGPPARVLFTVADRCVTPGATCTPSTPSNWPDVPWDQNCTGGTCASTVSPTFWTQKRLTRVTTQVWNTSTNGYADVDAWDLTHSFAQASPSNPSVLSLDRIQRSGLVGGTGTVPAVTFNRIPLDNRVDGIETEPPYLPYVRYRISSITNGTGGQIEVTYTDRECVRTALPAPGSNTKRCFPTYWSPEGASPVLDWFHKYVVTGVNQGDLTGGGATVVTGYEYPDPPAWHFDDEDGLVPVARKTWSQWRGYGRVRVVTGGTDVTRTLTEYRYMRGMDGDKLAGGGQRDEWVADGDGGTLEDKQPLAGFLREQATYQAHGSSTVLAAQINDPWISGVTASNTQPWGTKTAQLVDTGSVRGRTLLAPGVWRRTQVVNTFDNTNGPGRGLLTHTSDLADTATAADDRCTKYSYAQNSAAWMLDYPSRVETLGVACTATPTYPDDLLADVRNYYDGNPVHGAAPTRGNLTKTEQADSWSGGSAHYLQTSAAGNHDPYGRPLEVFDADNERTSTVYTPATGAPVTRTTVTNPLGHVTTTDLQPAWGQPTAIVDANQRRTDLDHDPLGRLLRVWLPGRAKTSHPTSPNTEYQYLVRADAANVVITRSLLPDAASYRSGYQFLDGLLRPRQTQQGSPGPSGGRILTETFYDSRGQAWKSSGPYYNSGAPDQALMGPIADVYVGTQTLTEYDGAGRVTASIFRQLGAELWRTTTTYGGDRVHVDPPEGATATTTIADARGQATELRQYTGGAPTGGYDATRYTYTDRGELKTVTDPAGNLWSYSYDLRGLRTQSIDPDKGATSFSYDNAGRLATSTDARNEVLAYVYDRLGRKTELRDDSPTGVLRARWTYDTLGDGTQVRGLPVSATRYDNGNAYVSAVEAYDPAYRPTATAVTIPAAEGALAGTYRTTATYKPDGSPDTVTPPAAGGLPAETLSYGYTATLGLPNTLAGATPYVHGTSYTELAELGQLALSTAASGKKVWQSFYYEIGSRRLSQILVQRQSTGSQQGNVFFSYDPAGNVTRIADLTVNQPPDVQCFRYDHLRRVSEAWTPATDSCPTNPTVAALGGPGPYWHSLRYDQVGNRTTETQHGSAGDTVRTYAYPAAGQPRPHAVASVDTTGVGGPKTDSYGYNNTGDTTSRTLAGQPGQTLTWDAEGRLAASTSNGQTTTFLYDADGNRLLRRDPTSTTLYLGDLELACNRATGAVTGTRYYSHAGRTVGVRQGATVTWLIADHHGTNTWAFDAVSLAVQRRRSLPFGALRGTPPASWPGEKGFVGGALDPTTGLTHIGARQYDPALGRFISVDPIMDPADPQQMHGYAYANNNPTTWSDPTGLIIYSSCPDGVCAKGAGIGAHQNTTPASNPASKCCGNAPPKKAEDYCCNGGRRTEEPVVIDHHNGIITMHIPSTQYFWINGVAIPASSPDKWKLLRGINDVIRDAQGYWLPGVDSAFDTDTVITLMERACDGEVACSGRFLLDINFSRETWDLGGDLIAVGVSAASLRAAAKVAGFGSRYIYRTGAQTDNALTHPGGVSFRASVSSSADGVQKFKPGDKIFAVDTTLLPRGSVKYDNSPDGHVTVFASPEQIRRAIVSDFPNSPLAELKRLDDGSFRLPK